MKSKHSNPKLPMSSQILLHPEERASPVSIFASQIPRRLGNMLALKSIKRSQPAGSRVVFRCPNFATFVAKATL